MSAPNVNYYIRKPAPAEAALRYLPGVRGHDLEHLRAWGVDVEVRGTGGFQHVHEERGEHSRWVALRPGDYVVEDRAGEGFYVTSEDLFWRTHYRLLEAEQ